MQKNLDAETFLDFKGWESFRKICVPQNMITGVVLDKLTNFDVENSFLNTCENFVETKYYKVNKILFNKIQLNIISKGYDYTTNLLIKFFEKKYKEFYNNILESMSKKTFTVEYFCKEYYKINKKLSNLKYLLSNIDYSYKNKDGKKSEYSFINLVKNYVSYNIVINSKYSVEEKEYYLYELFIKEIEENFNTETVLQIFKIFDFYNKFSYAVKNKKNKNGQEYFNTDLNKKITLSEDTTNRFLTRVIEIINKKIMELTKNSNVSVEQNERDIKYIRNLITVSPELCNKNIFMVLYKKALTVRLKQNSNPDIESEFLKSLDPQNDIDSYIKMKNQINDVRLNKQHNMIYRKISVDNGSSEKYKHFDISQFDREKVNIHVCRSYDWEYENVDTENYKLPLDLSIYLDIFNAYYKDRFNERQLSWLYDDSHGVVEFLTDKLYNVKMNLLQLSVFYSINETAKSALELSNELKINLQKLGIVLNSLLLSKLIHRSQGSSDNPNIKFSVNEEFKYNENNFSIVGIYEKVKKLSENKESVEDTSNLPSETVLRAKILANVISEKSVNKDKLIDSINNYFKINIPSKYLDKVIKDLTESNDRIKLNSNTLIFVSDENDKDDDNKIDDIDDLDEEVDTVESNKMDEVD